MTIGIMLKDVPTKKEFCPGCMLLLVILYLGLIKYSGLSYEYIFIHPIILAAIWIFESKTLNILLGNMVILRFAQAGMFIYLSHNAVKMAIPGEWWFKTIVCVIVGIILSEVYQYIIVKLHSCNN